MQKRLVKNLGIKLSSLVLALVLWFSLYGGWERLYFIREGEREIVVPVKVLGTPVSLFRIEVEPKEVKLVLTGPREILQGLTVDGVSLFVAVEGLRKGTYELHPRVHLPEGIRVLKRQPQTVRVILNDRWIIREEPFSEEVPFE